MNTATANYPYTVNPTGDDFLFTYKRAKLGYKTVLPALWPALILSCFLAYYQVKGSLDLQTPTEIFSMWIFYIIVYTIVLSIGIVVVLNLFRRPGSFKITKQGIALGDTLFEFSHIAEFYVKSPEGSVSYSLKTSPTGYVAYGGDRVEAIGFGAAATTANAVKGVVNVATKLSYITGQMFMLSIRKKSCKVCFMYGKSEKALVSMVDKTTAEIILKKLDTMI